MHYLKCLLLALALCLSGSAMADEASRVEAAKMLDVLDMATVLDTTIDASLDAQIAANPEMAPYKGVMRAFFSKYMSYSALKPQLIDIYATEFTANELAETTAFYSTETGKKVLAKLPSLMGKGAKMGQQMVQDHIPELQAAIKKEAARIQAMQAGSTQNG
jgi:uncharacterized protein